MERMLPVMERQQLTLAVVAGMALMSGGCLDRVLEATLAPQQAVAESLSQLSSSTAQAVTNTDAAVQDIDRILTQNPGAANREELLAMRNQLAGAQASGSVPTSDFHAQALSRHDSPLYRSLPHRNPDHPRRLPRVQSGTAGITQPELPVISAGRVPESTATSWISADVSPIRLR